MKRFEYKLWREHLFENSLEKLGAEGWLLVHSNGIAMGGPHVFVRELPQGPGMFGGTAKITTEQER